MGTKQRKNERKERVGLGKEKRNIEKEGEKVETDMKREKEGKDK